MRKVFWILMALVVAGTGGWVFYSYHTHHASRITHHEKYSCPMHPQIISDKPGSCPICGMTLRPVEALQEDGMEHKHLDNSFLVTPQRRQSVGVKSAEVVQKNLSQEIRLPGRVAFDQELYVTESEYVEGLQNRGDDILKIVETKLKRLGISDEELKKLKSERKVDESLFIPKEGKPFWVYASVYESDLSLLTVGMKAELQLPTDKSVMLEGIVKQVEPILDAATKTAKVRILFSKLPASVKPETYVDIILKKDLGEALAIPFDSVIDTGVKQVVLVDLGEGYLEPREVVVGAKAGNDYPVMKGLSAGEKIITSAHFLLDSESQIQTALKQFGEMKGHQH